MKHSESGAQLRTRLLEDLYGDDVATRYAPRLQNLLAAASNGMVATTMSTGLWSECDIWLISYPGQFQEPTRAPLQTLAAVLRRHLSGIFNGVHILPFYPSSSDEGFSVTDYESVDPAHGTWEDIEAIGADARLMVDAVINHASVQGEWFRGWQDGEIEYRDFFRTSDPGLELSSVVRARQHPLLTTFPTIAGERWVWTTFSPDQADLDYGNPEVLLRIVEVLASYVGHGAEAVRVDAAGFMWKQEGTSSIHLPQTHALIQLLASCLRELRPDVILITETNVPHSENISYLGSPTTQEADAVYQFPLPPLTLHSYLSGDAGALMQWLADLRQPRVGTTFFNFLSSHDGVGVRPLEGIVSDEDLDRLVAFTESGPGFVSRRTSQDGNPVPYELNATWFDLVGGQKDEDDALARHLGSHALLLSLAGIAGVYIHSVLASSGDRAAVEAGAEPRAINRKAFRDLAALERELTDPGSRAHRSLAGLRRMATWRRTAPFHPNAAQRLLDVPPTVIGVERQAKTGERAWTFVSVADHSTEIQVEPAELAQGAIRAGVEDSMLRLGPWGSATLLEPTR